MDLAGPAGLLVRLAPKVSPAYPGPVAQSGRLVLVALQDRRVPVVLEEFKAQVASAGPPGLKGLKA